MYAICFDGESKQFLFKVMLPLKKREVKTFIYFVRNFECKYAAHSLVL